MIENSKGKMVNSDVVERMAMENERFRGLLTRCDEYLAEKGVIRDAKLRREIRAALSQQAEPAPAQDERMAWLPYLADSADGVTGHYAIARKNPAGYREVWNLRCHRWAAFSDDVLTMDEALAILKKLEMPTAPVAQTAPDHYEHDPVMVLVPRRSLERIVNHRDTAHVAGYLQDELRPFLGSPAPDVSGVVRALDEDARPAQTEQKPVGEVTHVHADGSTVQLFDYGMSRIKVGAKLYAAPIEQTEQRPPEESLVQNAKALLALDERGALAPHGIGGLAREVIEKLIAHVERTNPQPEQSALSGKCWIEVIGGREGPSIYIGDGEIAHRHAGNKPWGGGTTLHRFTVDILELVREATTLSAQGASK